jgi:hypothetical protein
MRRTALLLFAALAGCQDKGSPAAPPPATTTITPTAAGDEEPVDIGDSQGVFKDYRDNPIGASAKWKGKRVRFHQLVTEIGHDGDGAYVVFYSGARVYPLASELDAFGKLKRGDTVTVEGTVKGYQGEGADLVIGIDRAKLLR